MYLKLNTQTLICSTATYAVTEVLDISVTKDLFYLNNAALRLYNVARVNCHYHFIDLAAPFSADIIGKYFCLEFS